MKNIGFVFKPAKVKKEKPIRTSNSLVEGICLKDEGIWKIEVSIKDDANLVLEFTPNSYDLHRKVVFAHERDKEGRYQMFIRNQERDWKFAPGLNTQYTPFCEGFIYNGYIVRYKGKLYFDMNTLVRRYSAYART